MAPSISRSCAVSRRMRAICLLSMPGDYRAIPRSKKGEGPRFASPSPIRVPPDEVLADALAGSRASALSSLKYAQCPVDVFSDSDSVLAACPEQKGRLE